MLYKKLFLVCTIPIFLVAVTAMIGWAYSLRDSETQDLCGKTIVQQKEIDEMWKDACEIACEQISQRAWERPDFAVLREKDTITNKKCGCDLADGAYMVLYNVKEDLNR